MANDDKLIIKCPNCSKRLTVKPIPGIEHKNLTCPACKEVSPFKTYTILQKNPTPVAQGAADKSNDAGRTHIVNDNVGRVDNSQTMFVGAGGSVGRLIAVAGNLAPMQLKEGRNILGRANSSVAVDIALPSQFKYVSRQHLIIDVRRTAVGYIHTVMLCKSEVNKTYINSMQLVYGDQVILNDGDIVKLPDLSLRFDYK